MQYLALTTFGWKTERPHLSHRPTYALNLQHLYEIRPRKDKRGVDLISDALPFFFPNFAPPFSVEQVGMEAPACFLTNENVLALLRVARIIYESQMANDAAP